MIIEFNKGFIFLLCVIDIYSKDGWVIPSKDWKGIRITYAFQKILDESSWKLNKTWVDKGSEVNNRLMKSWLEKNAIEIYSWLNEGKFVIAERFIRNLKSKICKCMTSISKNVDIDKIDDIVNKFNNTYHATINMKPVDIKSNIYIDSSKQINNKNAKFKIDDTVRISKYKNIFAKSYTPNWSEEVFMIKKVKYNVLWAYIISNLNGEEIVEALQKINK